MSQNSQTIKKRSYLRSNLFKTLVAAKFIIITVFILVYNRALYVGEKDLSAQNDKIDTTSSTPPVPTTDEKAAPASTDAPSSTSADSSGEKKTDSESAKVAATKVTPTISAEEASEEAINRKSFLDNLLNLPSIDRENVKKDELGRYLSLAEQKLSQIEERTKLLSQREQQLLALEKSIENKIKALNTDRNFYIETVQKEKEVKQERLDKLILLYAKMEPKKASPVLAEMDKDLVVALFKAIPEKQVTKFLEGMPPEKAGELSEYFGRLKSGKEYELLKEVNQTLVDEFKVCQGLNNAH
ncbi:MAG: hypothetical protein KBD78_12590 [Oligoflexales bacterium]|nr:hypothetical protein [Oligoflexales bacterium]